jgi:transposase
MVRAGTLLTPLVERLHEQTLDYDVLQMDETRVQVLDEDGRSARSQSWMWVIRGGPPAQPVIHFHYDPSRGSRVPAAQLAGFKGYLQTDGCQGYARTLANPGVTGLGCWAHARRRFKKAQQAQPKGQSSAKLQQVLAWISKLYAFEKTWAALSDDERRDQRQQHAAPILDKIEAWARKQNVNPQSLLGQAIGYLLSEWSRLTVYLQDGRLRIDNNLVENAIRPFALGRKNWMFSQTADGANASAALYSVVETAKANGLNPYAYLKLLFTEIPQRSPETLDPPLPWNVGREQLERQATQWPLVC